MSHQPSFPALPTPTETSLEGNVPEGFSAKIFNEPFAYKEDDYPLVSIIIPTLNCAHSIGQTLDSLLNQDYPLFEVIVIDAGSTDRTLEVIKSYRHSSIKIYSVSAYFRYEMLNKGISHASGLYLNFLFPGDFYIVRSTLKYMMGLAIKHESPSLVFCGTLLREGKAEPKILFRHLTLKILKKGQQPTSLESCWFKRDVFQKIGKFNTTYTLRGGYELFCRFATTGRLHTVASSHILTDYDLRWMTSKMVLTHFRETFRTIWSYFGPVSTFTWLFLQDDFKRYLKLSLGSVRSAFMGKYG